MMRQPVVGAQAGTEPGPSGSLRHHLALRLLAEQPAAVLGNLAVLAVVIALLWTEAPHTHLLVWAAVIVATSTARGLVWLRARSAPEPEELLPTVRLVTTLVALAWGLGAAALIPYLSAQYDALLLLAISGLVAAAVGTLAGDRLAYRLFAFSIMAPPLLLVLIPGTDRFNLAAATLIVLFLAFTLRLQSRSYLDLVAQQRAAALLAASHREGRREQLFLDALFGSVPNAIAVVDSEGVCLGVNPGFEVLFGFPPPEVLGRSLFDVLVPASGRADVAVVLQRVLAGEAVVTESERWRKDGKLVTVAVSATRIEGDEEGRILLLYSDMTATRAAEAALRAAQSRLETVLASSTAIIYAVQVQATDFSSTWVSENLPRITGYEVDEALAPDWWYTHLHPDDRVRVLAELPRVLTENQLTMEYRFQQKDGGYRWVRDESRLIRDGDGNPQEVFGAWLDITDLKLAEDTMREGQRLAERSAKARSEFLANMSHEIRTPMNAVLGFTELLLDTELAPEQRRSLRLVQSAGETLLTLLNDILDVSKIEAEHMTLESIPFDLRYLLESTVSLLSVRALDRPVELIADVGADVPDMILGDPTRLRQVLTNLVGNALKFTEQGEVVVSAAREADRDGLCRLRFAVRDTGIGIDADKLDSIFEKFTQADTSMTRRYGGTGLGLSIAHRLVGLMGGELTVASEPGRGSEFGFTIAVPVEGERAAPSKGTASLANQRILIVDDNATNRRIVREMLGAALVTMEEAATAAAGLEALRQAEREGQPYAVAIIDAQMPDKDGFSLAAEIRDDPALTRSVRLLMLTSAGERGDTQRCREVGIEAYLMKPASRSDLLEAITVLLGNVAKAPGADLITRHSIAESRPRMRILLAEDNQVNQEVAATMLRKRGHAVTVVNNGREAVDAVATGGPFDIVLMDIQMPELDGFAATREIRARPGGATLPILALTAHTLTGERERCIAEGLNGYVPKPFRPHELFAAVEEFGSLAPAGSVPTLTPVLRPRATPPTVDLAGFRGAMREAGAEEAVEGILDLFIANAPERLAALATAAGDGDGPAMGRAAHAFKSPAGSIGATGLAALLQRVELAATAGQIAQARAAFEEVGPEAASVLQYLRLDRGKAVAS